MYHHRKQASSKLPVASSHYQQQKPRFVSKSGLSFLIEQTFILKALSYLVLVFLLEFRLVVLLELHHPLLWPF
jgi:hypothetical protein